MRNNFDPLNFYYYHSLNDSIQEVCNNDPSNSAHKNQMQPIEGLIVVLALVAVAVWMWKALK